MSKSRKILDEVGDQISSFAKEAILSIDRLEKELAELKKDAEPAPVQTEQPKPSQAQPSPEEEE